MMSLNLYSCDSREKVGEVGELAGPRAVVLAAAGQVGAVPAPRIWTGRGDMGVDIAGGRLTDQSHNQRGKHPLLIRLSLADVVLVLHSKHAHPLKSTFLIIMLTLFPSS